MILFDNAWHLISALIIFIIGFFLIEQLSKKSFLGSKLAIGLYLWHTIFCFIYLAFVIKSGGDVNLYVTIGGRLDNSPFELGTVALINFVRFIQYFDISLLGISLIFNIFGSLGLLFFAISLKECIGHSLYLNRLTLLILLLPSVSFWSAGVGKDSISFMAIGLALYAAVNFNKRIVLMMLAVALMLFVRPHMAGMMLIALVASMALKKDIPLIPRVIIGAIGLLIAAVMIPFALKYAGLEADASNLGSYIETRQGYNQQGGGGVDISSMSLPMQMFTYIARPLPFEARSITQLLASLDNMLILYLLFIGMKVQLSVKNIQLTGNRVFMWWYVGISWVLLSMTTANLGIAMRQKWMFVPILMFLLMSIIAAAQEKTTENNYYDNS